VPALSRDQALALMTNAGAAFRASVAGMQGLLRTGAARRGDLRRGAIDDNPLTGSVDTAEAVDKLLGLSRPANLPADQVFTTRSSTRRCGRRRGPRRRSGGSASRPASPCSAWRFCSAARRPIVRSFRRTSARRARRRPWPATPPHRRHRRHARHANRAATRRGRVAAAPTNRVGAATAATGRDTRCDTGPGTATAAHRRRRSIARACSGSSRSSSAITCAPISRP